MDILKSYPRGGVHKGPSHKRLKFGVEIKIWKPSPIQQGGAGHPRGYMWRKKADDRISGTTCLGGRKIHQKRKSSRTREWSECNVRKVNGQECFKKCYITDEEDNKLDPLDLATKSVDTSKVRVSAL